MNGHIYDIDEYSKERVEGSRTRSHAFGKEAWKLLTLRAYAFLFNVVGK